MDELEIGTASEAGAGENAAPSIEDTARAAVAAIEEREAGEKTAETGDTPPAEKAPASEAKPAVERVRGADGKFIAKDGDAPAKAAVAPAEETTGKDAETTDPKAASTPLVGHPPPGWPADAKAEWTKLSPAIQAAVIKRENEVSQGFAQKSAEMKRFEPIDQILAPRRQQFAMNGMTEAQGVAQLFALSDFAAKDPRGFLTMFARDRGIDLANLIPRQADGSPVPQPQIDPNIAALHQQVSGLTQFIQSQQQQQANAAQAATSGEVMTFRNATLPTGHLAHPHFEAVRPQMASLIEHGHAQTLDQAYDMAVFAHPTIRAQILDDQRKAYESERQAAETKRIADAKAEAERARKAAGTTIRATGALPGASGSVAKSMEETAREAYDRVNAA